MRGQTERPLRVHSPDSLHYRPDSSVPNSGSRDALASAQLRSWPRVHEQRYKAPQLVKSVIFGLQFAAPNSLVSRIDRSINF